MKLHLTIIVFLFSVICLAQDTSRLVPFNKRAVAAMDAQAKKDTIRIDTSKRWKKLLVLPQKKLTWWDITKQFVSKMWDDKPYMVIIIAKPYAASMREEV